MVKKILLSKCAVCGTRKSRFMKDKRNFVKRRFFLKCKKSTENTNASISKTSNGKKILLSKCAVCGIRKSRFMKDKRNKWIIK